MQTCVWLLCLLAVPSLAQAGKLKAKFDCKQVLKDGSRFEIGGGYRIAAVSIECKVTSLDHKLLEGTARIKTMWHKGTVLQEGKEHHGSPIGGEGDGPGFEYMFMLDKGVDWDECATDISIPVLVTDVNGQKIFEAKKLYLQSCPVIPVSPPVGSGSASASAKPAAKAKPALDKATWAETALADIPADARDVTQRFIDAVVDGDPPALGTLAGTGVKKGKKTLKGADVYDLEAATGIRPQKQCDEQQKNCHWGPWTVIKKGPGEFWIYSDSDSGYGSFACAVFGKRANTWQWTAVKTYDTGEP